MNGRGREDADLLPQGFHRLLPALLVVHVQDAAGVAPAPDRPGNELGGQDLQLPGANDIGGDSSDFHVLLWIPSSNSPVQAGARPTGPTYPPA